MAFGITRTELYAWKAKVEREEIAFLTHYWIDDRFPGCKTVTKVGCANVSTLIEWGRQYDLKEEWIDHKEAYPHFDLFGSHEYAIMKNEGLLEQLNRFK
ncbi:hypothetical protein C7437_101603 [Psychrobacillus insolitus]|uniref:YneQ n=1 Tax=Psychrobacillus insolitus TaxID=1461 RepID=A0A2W7PGU2_9BACI|nr:hypothetical protein [Psychrobacillus insolitus]PZX07486.1 hypothetical protein C7437_101603 [Psychrobacillus insolitus]